MGTVIDIQEARKLKSEPAGAPKKTKREKSPRRADSKTRITKTSFTIFDILTGKDVQEGRYPWDFDRWFFKMGIGLVQTFDLTPNEARLYMMISYIAWEWRAKSEERPGTFGAFLASYSQLSKLSGIGRKEIKRAVNGLVTLKLIIQKPYDGNAYKSIYAVRQLPQSIQKASEDMHKMISKLNRAILEDGELTMTAKLFLSQRFEEESR